MLYRRELVDLNSSEGKTLMECMLPGIMGKELRDTVASRIRKVSRMLKAQYFDIDPDMLLKLFQDFLKETEENWNYMLPTELNEIIKKGNASDFFLLDVRKPEDFHKEHIPGTVNIFWLDILKEENLNTLPVDKEIIVICYLGHTSSQLLVMLSMLGYRCRSLKFGMGKSPDSNIEIKGWLDYDYPVIRQ